ncbi:hypothetical protein [Bacillus cereus]
MEVNGIWYYRNEDGAMVAGEQFIDR